jgi:hypothetical protein
MPDVAKTARQLRVLLEQREPRQEIIPALLGNGDGTTVKVANRPGYHYVRLHGQLSERAIAWNPHTAAVYDLPVDVRVMRRGQTPIAYEVIGVSAAIGQGWGEPYLPSHGSTHEYTPGGYDRINVYQAALVPFRVEPRSMPNMTVRVRWGVYYVSSWQFYGGGISPTFVAPVSGTRRDLLYLTGNKTLAVKAGTVFGVPGALKPPVPEPLVLTVPLAAVYLESTTTTLVEANIEDVRLFINPVGQAAQALITEVGYSLMGPTRL